MNTNILCVGKLKEPYLKQAQAEYLKRLAPFTKTKITEVAEEGILDESKQKDIVLSKEGARLLKSLTPFKMPAFSLCIDGKGLTSLSFAELIKNHPKICFIIGGSHGIHEKVTSLGGRISLSPLTFPHQLARIILLEQIYRAHKILKGGKYHK